MTSFVKVTSVCVCGTLRDVRDELQSQELWIKEKLLWISSRDTHVTSPPEVLLYLTHWCVNDVTACVCSPFSGCWRADERHQRPASHCETVQLSKLHLHIRLFSANVVEKPSKIFTHSSGLVILPLAFRAKLSGNIRPIKLKSKRKVWLKYFLKLKWEETQTQLTITETHCEFDLGFWVTTGQMSKYESRDDSKQAADAESLLSSSRLSSVLTAKPSDLNSQRVEWDSELPCVTQILYFRLRVRSRCAH